MVPPPTVPTSMDGMDTVISRSAPSLILKTRISVSTLRSKLRTGDSRFHESHTIGTLYILRRILTRSKVHRLSPPISFDLHDHTTSRHSQSRYSQHAH